MISKYLRILTSVLTAISFDRNSTHERMGTASHRGG